MIAHHLSPATWVLLLIAGMVAISALVRRVPLLGTALRLVSLAVVLWLGVEVLSERAPFDPALGGIAGLIQPDGQRVSGGELRVPLARDGHYWVRARVNGVRRRMLVDSGATITALSSDTAAAAGLTVRDPLFPVVLRTANGAITARTARVETLKLGNVVARDLAVVVSPAFGDTDVLGMNFLSQLKSWRVEGQTLVLRPRS